MTLSERQKLFTFNISQFVAFAYKNGFTLTYGEAWRPDETQKMYYDTGRSKTLTNNHGSRIAVDFNIFYNDRMLFAPGISNDQYIADLKTAQVLGDYWTDMHTDNRWGADWNRNHDALDEKFRDPYHFESKIPPIANS